jgi:hypothetical protein
VLIHTKARLVIMKEGAGCRSTDPQSPARHGEEIQATRYSGMSFGPSEPAGAKAGGACLLGRNPDMRRLCGFDRRSLDSRSCHALDLRRGVYSFHALTGRAADLGAEFGIGMERLHARTVSCAEVGVGP